MSFIIHTPLFKFVSIIKPMKNILILTDFSKNSWNSIEYALALFQNRSYNFYLLNATDVQEDEFEEGEYGSVGLLPVKIKKNPASQSGSQGKDYAIKDI